MATFGHHWSRGTGRVTMRSRTPDLVIQVRHVGLPDPETEYRFHPIRKWRIDYCWPQPEFRLAVEIEGGAFIDGRHVQGAGFRKDIEKYNALTLAGFFILRFLPEDIQSGLAISVIRQWFKERKGAQ